MSVCIVFTYFGFVCSEMIAIDRRAQDRFITLVPVLDVDDSVSEAVDSLWPTLHEILTCFPSLEYVYNAYSYPFSLQVVTNSDLLWITRNTLCFIYEMVSVSPHWCSIP